MAASAVMRRRRPHDPPQLGQLLLDHVQRQSRRGQRRRPDRVVGPQGHVHHVLVERRAVPSPGVPKRSGRGPAIDLGPVGVVLHPTAGRLRIGQHVAFGVEEGDACADFLAQRLMRSCSGGDCSAALPRTASASRTGLGLQGLFLLSQVVLLDPARQRPRRAGRWRTAGTCRRCRTAARTFEERHMQLIKGEQ